MNINEISNLIKKSLPKENLKLCAEVRKPKIYQSGHMYLTMKDDTGLIDTKIWKSNITDELQNLKDGDNIIVLGKLDYYSARGSLSFIINKLLEKKGEGTLKIQYNKIMKDFENKGYFLQDKKIKIPDIIKNILLLTSKNGAAIEDFYHTLENGNCKIKHTLINVIVQGTDCPSNICKVLKNPKTLENKNYDMIVITRGGGSFEDLFGFCQPELIETIYNLKIPVLSAIGHQIDTTLLDYVADYVAATPSLAGQFIVNHNKKYIDTLIVKKNIMLNNFIANINNKVDILNNKKNKINDFKYELIDIKTRVKQELYKKINNKNIFLTELKVKYKLSDNIELFSTKNKEVDYKKFTSICENNKKFYIKWGDTILKIRAYDVVKID